MWNSGHGLLFFSNGYPVVPSLFVENTFHSPLNCLSPFVKNELCVSELSLLLRWPVYSYSHHCVGISLVFMKEPPSLCGWRTLSSHREHGGATIQVPLSGSHFHGAWNIANARLWPGILQVKCVLHLGDFSMFRSKKFGVIHVISLQFRSRNNAEKKNVISLQFRSRNNAEKNYVISLQFRARNNAEKKYVWRHDWAQTKSSPKLVSPKG